MARADLREIGRLEFTESQRNRYRMSIHEKDGFLHYQLAVNDTAYALSGLIGPDKLSRLPQDVTAAMTKGDLTDQVAGLVLEDPSRVELVNSHCPYPDDPLDPRAEVDADDRPGP